MPWGGGQALGKGDLQAGSIGAHHQCRVMYGGLRYPTLLRHSMQLTEARGAAGGLRRKRHSALVTFLAVEIQ
jgi:hypothetical protein